jgi:uncharacterized membrane protein YoaK (UPF0700 family)
MKAFGDRRVMVAITVVVGVVVGALINIITNGFAWWVLALIAALVAMLITVEWRLASPERRPYVLPPMPPVGCHRTAVHPR